MRASIDALTGSRATIAIEEPHAARHAHRRVVDAFVELGDGRVELVADRGGNRAGDVGAIGEVVVEGALGDS